LTLVTLVCPTTQDAVLSSFLALLLLVKLQFTGLSLDIIQEQTKVKVKVYDEFVHLVSHVHFNWTRTDTLR
jgi:hypothetical protein